MPGIENKGRGQTVVIWLIEGKECSEDGHPSVIIVIIGDDNVVEENGPDIHHPILKMGDARRWGIFPTWGGQ